MVSWDATVDNTEVLVVYCLWGLHCIALQLEACEPFH